MKPAKKKETLPHFSADIEAKLKKFSPLKQKNLRFTLAKYERGKTNNWEDRKLGEAGLIDPPANGAGETGLGSDSDICYSQASLAAKLARHYQNPDGTSQLIITITAKVICKWCAGHNLGRNQVPAPGSIKGTSREYSVRAWVEWFDKNMLAEKSKAAPATAAVPLTKPVEDEEDFLVMEQREKRDAIKHRRWERDRERGEYVHRSIALATGIAAVKRLHLMVKQEDERGQTKLRREKLLELGAAPELVEKFCVWDQEEMRAVTDRREMAMEAAATAIEIPTTTN